MSTEFINRPEVVVFQESARAFIKASILMLFDSFKMQRGKIYFKKPVLFQTDRPEYVLGILHDYEYTLNGRVYKVEYGLIVYAYLQNDSPSVLDVEKYKIKFVNGEKLIELSALSVEDLTTEWLHSKLIELD